MATNEGATPGATPGATEVQPPVQRPFNPRCNRVRHIPPYPLCVAPALGGGVHAKKGAPGMVPIEALSHGRETGVGLPLFRSQMRMVLNDV